MHELLSPSACFSCLFSPSLSSPACTPVIHSHAQEMNPPRKKHTHKKKNATMVGCLPKALEGRVRLCGKIGEHHLFCCDVHKLNRERSVESEERVSGGVGEKERERERSSEENRETVEATDLCACVCGAEI